MKKLVFSFALLLTATALFAQKEGWTLHWSDEFNKNGLPDSSIWSFDTAGNAYGWGNNELQYYTNKKPANAWVKDGILKITARKEKAGDKNYTSARLITKGKASFVYGRMEIRAKLPPGRGTWPAIWMLGENIGEAGWPACGEIDIMEHVGYEKDSIYGTIHSQTYNHVKGTQKTKAIFIKNPYTAYHVYSIEWTPDRMDFYVDDQLYNSVQNEHLTEKEWPFDKPFFFILNLAVGGNWGGKMGVDEEIFPATMEVDYVRVYKKNP